MTTFFFILGFCIGGIAMYIYMDTYNLMSEMSKEEENDDEIVEEEENKEIVDEDFDNESGDDSNYYYVKFPHLPRPVEICLENSLLVGDNLSYREKIYKIVVVLHKVDGHTVFVAEPKLESNGN